MSTLPTIAAGIFHRLLGNQIESARTSKPSRLDEGAHRSTDPEPPQSYSHGDVGWVIAANLAAELAVWARLLGYSCDGELQNADPDTLRYWAFSACPRSSPATPVSGVLVISPDWPLKDAFPTFWHRLCMLITPA